MGDEAMIEVVDGIQKRIIKNGKGGRKPGLTWPCTVHVDIKQSVDEKKFPQGTLEIVVGNGCGPYERLLERCVESMHLDEESEFVTTLLPDVPDLRFVVTLKSFTEKPYIFQWTDADKITQTNSFKNAGASLFRENRVEEAFYKFSAGLKLLITTDSCLESDDPDAEVVNLRVALYNNLAACQLHFKNYNHVVELCTNSLNLIRSSKALYRRALAYVELEELEKAETDLVELLKMEPKNKAAQEKYALVRELDRTNRENYQAIIKKMFR